MSVLRTVAAVAAALALVAPSGASADDTVAGVNQGLAGTISATTELSHTPGLSAQCTFAGVLTPSNTLIIEFGGAAVARPLGPIPTTPLVTAVFCEINNSSEGGTNSQTSELSLNGAATATASSTLLATSGPKEWPVMDITVCVSGFVVYGPTPVTVVNLARTCLAPNV